LNGRTGLRRSTSKRLAAVLAGAVLHGATLPGVVIAQDPDQAAREAAQAVGAAGQAAARAVATDAAQALEVPGFAGTDLSQADLSAGELEGAGQNALADPDDLGGGLGRALARGALSGPAVSVSEEEPGIRRAESVQSSPNAPEWRADGLVSGTVSECARELDGAQSGGTCGAVTYCVGAGCETIATPANSEFVSAATQLNLVMEMGGEEFDRRDMRIFSGEWAFCTIRLLGAQNCCTNSGIFIEAGLLGCEVHEIELAEARSQGLTHYWGEYCAKRILGICRRRDRAWCVFTSQLGRILHEQARPQLGIGWDDCDGFTVSQIQRIDFDRVDLSEYTDTLLDPSRPPGIVLPDGQDTATSMRERIGELYERNE